MTFVKVGRNKSYYKRFQVKFRRRREGKTDYRARKRLICQDKNKYNSPKYRLVVRFTNSQVICQIVYSDIEGDKTLCSAYSSELKKKYDFNGGVKNYAAAYATGLLIARRLLTKLDLAGLYEGNKEINAQVVTTDGEDKTYYVAALNEERRPFRALLDVGIQTTSTGARLFGALKGAVDGGLDIPHSNKRFPGYDKEKSSYDADTHKARIFGEHISTYMKLLQEENEEKFQRQFAKYTTAGIGADDIEGTYTELFEKIRADPSPLEKKAFTPDEESIKHKRHAKRSLKQFKNRVAQRIAASKRELQAVAAATHAGEDDAAEEEEA